MRRLLPFLLLAAGLAQPAPAQTLAIVHGRAWTMAGDKPVDDATILIRDGKIVSVRAAGPVPPGAATVDAKGRTVTPGLVSAATQVGLIEISGAADTTDEAVNGGQLGPAFDVASAINPNSVTVDQARADGVLWALTFPSGSAVAPFSGTAALLRLKPGGDIVERPGAAMFVRIGGAAAAGAGGSRAASWSLLREALREARALKAGQAVAAEDRLFRWADLVALQPVLAGQMPLAIQTHRQSDISQLIRIGGEFAIRIVLVGGAEAWTLADALAQAKIPVILDPIGNLPMSYDEVGARLDNAAILARAGVTIGLAAATNAIDQTYNVGPASRVGAGIAVANGLSYPEALRALTLGPASIWGAAERAGSLEPGKAADLIIWDGDPLEPASAPAIVIVEGRQVSTETHQSRLADRYAPNRSDDPWPPAYR